MASLGSVPIRVDVSAAQREVLKFEEAVMKAHAEERTAKREFMLEILNSGVACVLTFFVSGTISGLIVYAILR